MLQLFNQVMHHKTFSRLSILGTVAVSLLLTGCIGVQTNLAFYGEGQWTGVQAITISPEFVELMESEGTDGGELTTETEGLDEWLQQAQGAAADQSLNVTFDEVTEEDGSLTYVIQADGSQYDTLNEIFFQGEADISVAEVDGQRQITIRYDTSETTEGEATPEDEALSAEMMEAFGFRIITRISGGNIISHNADRVEGNTAFWDTPGLVEITLTEAAIFDTGTLAPQDMQLGSGSSLTTLLEGLEQSAENATTETTSESTTESTETTAESTDSTAATQETATESADDTATTPATEGDALPVSGAILPDGSSAASLIFAGLVLISLVGAGAVTATLHRE